MRRIIYAWILTITLTSCVTAPYSQRQQFILVPSLQEEKAIGETTYGQMLAEVKVVQQGPELDQIRRVGQRIAPIADADLMRFDRPTFDWEFNLIKDDQTINAWALPGGKVAFYTGILPICQNDAGVAVVMGHEIGHALARHGAERMTQSLGVELAAIAIDTALANKDEQKRNEVLGFYGIGSDLLLVKPFSRNQESEADHIGIMLMAKAGYDPQEAVHFWERMQNASHGSPPEFLSTHPSHASRIENLKKLLPQAMQQYQAVKQGKK